MIEIKIEDTDLFLEKEIPSNLTDFIKQNKKIERILLKISFKNSFDQNFDYFHEAYKIASKIQEIHKQLAPKQALIRNLTPENDLEKGKFFITLNPLETHHLSPKND